MLKQRKEVLLLDILGLNQDLALQDVMEMYTCASTHSQMDTNENLCHFTHARIGVLMTH